MGRRGEELVSTQAGHGAAHASLALRPLHWLTHSNRCGSLPTINCGNHLGSESQRTVMVHAAIQKNSKSQKTRHNPGVCRSIAMPPVGSRGSDTSPCVCVTAPVGGTAMPCVE